MFPLHVVVLVTPYAKYCTHNMHDGIKSIVSVNGENSMFFSCECGVRRGENLSPLLISIYLNDLEHFLL